jgi:Predicted nucleoside-diphosphate-sugar epimerases
MLPERTILVTGITGKQGGAVARALVGKGFKLRGLTRKPDSDPAKAMAQLGVEICQGDFDDLSSLTKAMTGCWGVYAVQNTWEAGVEKEETQGKAVAKLAKELGVQHFVYSSVGSAHKATGIPHFDNKHRIEETVRSLAFPSHAIIRPVFFMENLTTPWFLNGDTLATAMKPDTKLQMIAVEDIGKIGAAAFILAPKTMEIDIAGDAVSMAEVAAALSAKLGRTIEFKQLPIDAVRANSADFATMLEWFESTGYSADIPAVEKAHGAMVKFSDWVAKNA